MFLTDNVAMSLLNTLEKFYTCTRTHVQLCLKTWTKERNLNGHARRDGYAGVDVQLAAARRATRVAGAGARSDQG